jgi:Sec-independent protein translocase protein TatA
VGKLPQIGGALGRGIREFRSAARDDDDAPAVEEAARSTSSTNAFCTKCGVAVAPGLRFCTACGHSL